MTAECCADEGLGFVDPHAEGNGRHDHPAIIVDETILVLGAHTMMPKRGTSATEVTRMRCIHRQSGSVSS